MVRSILQRSVYFHIALILLCGAIGFGISAILADLVLLHQGKDDLDHYSTHLLTISQQVFQEVHGTINSAKISPSGACSDEDLTALREIVFRSSTIRDIGRLRDGRLICSAEIGRLSTLRYMQPPDVQDGTLNVIAHEPLLVSNDHSFGYVLTDQDMAVVLNPGDFSLLNNPPKSFTGLVYNPYTVKLTSVYGPPLKLTPQQVLAGSSIERDGMYYQPKCLASTFTCIVTMEPRSAILAANTPLRFSIVFAGIALGGAIGLICTMAFRRRLSMEQQLRRAIQSETLYIDYQPIVDLATKQVVAAEALVRWRDESGVCVRPDIFVALAEECGFITELTRFVISNVTREMGDLLATGEFQININISAPDLVDRRFATHLATCMKRVHAAPSSIGLEITERMTASQDGYAHALAELQRTGHLIYIDDFGTGYSSLSYLHRLRINAIKVDGVFTRTIGTEAVTASVVPQILAMAEQLGLQVVVEGIETEEQAAYFRTAQAGILGQGWLYGRPMSATMLRERLGLNHPVKSSSSSRQQPCSTV